MPFSNSVSMYGGFCVMSSSTIELASSNLPWPRSDGDQPQPGPQQLALARLAVAGTVGPAVNSVKTRRKTFSASW